MRGWIVVVGLLFAKAALACDFVGETDPLRLLAQVPIVAVARAQNAHELKFTEVLAGQAAGSVTFEGTSCDPVLVPGKPYLVFLNRVNGKLYGAAANDSAIELPDDGLAIRSIVSLLQKWRGAKTEAERRALLPQVEATRVKALVESAKKRRS